MRTTIPPPDLPVNDHDKANHVLNVFAFLHQSLKWADANFIAKPIRVPHTREAGSHWSDMTNLPNNDNRPEPVKE